MSQALRSSALTTCKRWPVDLLTEQSATMTRRRNHPVLGHLYRPPQPPPNPALMPVPPAHIHTHQPRLCGLSNLTRDGQVPDDDDLDDPRNRRKRVAAAAAAQAEEEKRRMEEWVLFYVCLIELLHVSCFSVGF